MCGIQSSSSPSAGAAASLHVIVRERGKRIPEQGRVQAPGHVLRAERAPRAAQGGLPLDAVSARSRRWPRRTRAKSERSSGSTSRCCSGRRSTHGVTRVELCTALACHLGDCSVRTMQTRCAIYLTIFGL